MRHPWLSVLALLFAAIGNYMSVAVGLVGLISVVGGAAIHDYEEGLRER